MASVALEGVSKAFPGGVTAVDDLNLAVRDREFLVLLGPSGCGKSTVLTMVAGLNEITTGGVVVANHEIEGPGPDRTGHG